MFRCAFSIALAIAAVSTAAGMLADDEKNHYNEKYNDPDTPKIRASFTTVPETDDIKVFREFIKRNETYGENNPYRQMRGRYKDEADAAVFDNELALATIGAADKMIALCEKQNNTALPQPMEEEHFSANIEKDDDTDYLFALKWKTVGFYHFDENDESRQKFEEFVKSLESDPAKKDIALFARSYWVCDRFYEATHGCGPLSKASKADLDQAVERFQATYPLAKEFFETYWEHPHFEIQADHVLHCQLACAGHIEDSPNIKIKKGTVMIPVLEFQRPVYAAIGTPHALGYVQYHDREWATYRILSADDPMAAFRKAVEEKKAELEKNLDKDWRRNIWALIGAAEKMERRGEALRYLYTTLRPVFAASKEDFAEEAVIVFDIELNQLALCGEELELEAVLLDGTKINLKDYRGKVVLLEYWFTGCGPCIGEFPNMTQAYEEWHEHGFEIIAFSTDEDLDALKAMIDKEKLPWLNASEKLSLERNLADSRKRYKIDAFPTSILIGKDGKVIRADARGGILNLELAKLLP